MNKEQREAVTHLAGPCLVAAGPGSGKTFIITHRIRQLIELHGADPSGIYTITFSKAAAREMQNRFVRMTEGRYPGAVFGTFHSFFYRIMRTGAGTAENEASFFQPGERMRLMHHVLHEQGISAGNEDVRALLKLRAESKNDGVEASEMSVGALSVLPPGLAGRFAAVCARYDTLRRESGKRDYDDLASDCLQLLRSRKEVLAAWRSRIRFLQIDEYQDINAAQFRIVRMLAGERGNLFCVGDDDQSIYGFRGAKPVFMTDFDTFFPGAKRIALKVNYRSHPAIVEGSGWVIRENRVRIDKPMHSCHAQEKLPADQGIFLRQYEDAAKETEALISALRKLPVQALSKSAVLFRTNAEVLAAAGTLARSGIPFLMKTRPKLLSEQPVPKDIFSFLALAAGTGGREDFLRIMNKPERFLSRECVSGGERLCREKMLAYYDGRPQMQDCLRAFFRLLDEAGMMRPSVAIGFMLHGARYAHDLKARLRPDEYADAEETIRQLREKAKPYGTIVSFLTATELEQRLLRRELSRQSPQDGRQRTDGVWLMTMHASKGLEFDNVYLPGLNEGALPSLHAAEQGLVEEERRMLYVAMTRARKRLFLSCADGNGAGKRQPSRFLMPLIHPQKHSQHNF